MRSAESTRTVQEIVDAIRHGELSTRDLVLISAALAERGNNTTSVFGQYGEELVRDAYNGKIGSFGQKGYDVETASGEKLQVKTFSKGKRPGNIRSFAYDVVTVEIDTSTAAVVTARRYVAKDLYEAFRSKWQTKYRHLNPTYAAWGGQPGDRYDRGWTIGTTVRFKDVTTLFR